MFESLSDRLQSIFDRLGKRGILTEQDVDVALREVRVALLEADVNFKVVKDFLARVRERVDALPEPAGFVVGQIAADEAEVLTVGVLPRWQRRGVGSILVEGLSRAAKRAEAKRLFLEVAADNQAAFELYRKLGFTAVGMRKGYYDPGGAGEAAQDALVLALPLDR